MKQQRQVNVLKLRCDCMLMNSIQSRICCNTLDGIYFADNKAQFMGLQIPIVTTNDSSAPVVEAVIPRYPHIPLRKAYLHVTAASSNTIHTFVIFFRYHPTLADNGSFRSLDPNIRWRGDAVILKAGKRVNFVHLRGSKEKSFSAFAVKR